MSTGGDPPSASSPGRPAADTPNRLVIRSGDGAGESGVLASSDTAVAGRETAAATATATTDVMQAVDGGDIIGVTLSQRYLVTRKVGQGGMGAVYEATHTLINKRVAIKVLLEKYAKREALVKRLKQEAQLASQVGNEHIIDITDFGNTDDGRTFVVMEYLEGESLAECLARENQLPEQRILRIASQAASALTAAHAKGIVHRDIKPENLFLLKRKEGDFVKVVDFGISKSLRASGEEEEPPRLTQTGMVLGTPLYMSPEQARGDEDLDHRVDVYALGVIMYEAASGRVPFAGTNYLSVISQVLNEEPQPLRAIRPELSEEFEAIVLRAMTKDRDTRYASASEMLDDLSALLDDPTRSTERAKITGPRRKPLRAKVPRVAWAIMGVSIVVVVIVLAVVWMNGGGSTKKQEPVVQPPLPPPPVAIDAGMKVVVPPIDAMPEARTVTVQFETTPPGAAILGDDGAVELCSQTPCVHTFVVHDDVEKLVAQLDGYNDQHFKINPFALDKDNKPVKVKLTKPARGQAPKTTRLPGKGSAGSAGSGSKSPGGSSKTGGELGGFPDKP
jgi:serine/threonine-protein kinase